MQDLTCHEPISTDLPNAAHQLTWALRRSWQHCGHREAVHSTQVRRMLLIEAAHRSHSSLSMGFSLTACTLAPVEPSASICVTRYPSEPEPKMLPE